MAGNLKVCLQKFLVLQNKLIMINLAGKRNSKREREEFKELLGIVHKFRHKLKGITDAGRDREVVNALLTQQC